jgi:manganese/zinc/iron transport system substrate-binding protein
MVADLVQRIAGGHAEVSALMSSGVDPHLFRPTARDYGRIVEADLTFYNGLHLEGMMQVVFEKAALRGKPLIAVTEKLPKERLRTSPNFPDLPDPHVWMDVRLWSDCCPHVAQTLAAADPEHAADYEAGARQTQAELLRFDEEVRRLLGTIPEAQRQLVTSHDAFEYFAAAYGVPARAVQGVSTDAEASIDTVRELIAFLVESRVPAVFVESSVNPRSLQAVVEGVAAAGGHVTIGGELYSDAMGPEGTFEGTYLGMIDHNVTTITRALGGQAPERGLSGQLSTAAPAAVPSGARAPQ